MNIDEMSKEKLLEIHECLEKTQGLGCPETKYRPKETLCFYCNKCWRIAIENKLESEDK